MRPQIEQFTASRADRDAVQIDTTVARSGERREMTGSPICPVHLFMRSIPRTAVDRTLHMAVASPPVLAFANSAVARHPQDHASGFLRESCNEADRIACATACIFASPHQQGTFTVELAPVGSPQSGVDYDYAGKQPIPAAGLAPARHTALWAASGITTKS
jgi:hypothetical protein